MQFNLLYCINKEVIFIFFRPTSPSKQQLPPIEKESVDTFNDQSVAPGEEPRKFDSTGMFHWCPNRTLEKSVMVSG
jgi:hypothetical protein